eukprot:1158789-Pelagomonas_calceolata.AAC.4
MDIVGQWQQKCAFSSNINAAKQLQQRATNIGEQWQQMSKTSSNKNAAMSNECCWAADAQTINEAE